MKNFNYKQVNDVVKASGKNWKYEKIGRVSKFTQTGRIPSLRIVRTILKLLNEANEIKC